MSYGDGWSVTQLRLECHTLVVGVSEPPSPTAPPLFPACSPVIPATFCKPPASASNNASARIASASVTCAQNPASASKTASARIASAYPVAPVRTPSAYSKTPPHLIGVGRTFPPDPAHEDRSPHPEHIGVVLRIPPHLIGVGRTFPPVPAHKDRSPHPQHIRIALTTRSRTLQARSRPPLPPLPLVARSSSPHPTTQYRAAANSIVAYHYRNTESSLACLRVRSVRAARFGHSTVSLDPHGFPSLASFPFPGMRLTIRSPRNMLRSASARCARCSRAPRAASRLSSRSGAIQTTPAPHPKEAFAGNPPNFFQTFAIHPCPQRHRMQDYLTRPPDRLETRDRQVRRAVPPLQDDGPRRG